ncbi:hypothetical protein F383_22092 [Gossypium arboreum]|uniref:Uncharacterized protein n=1 Tax=Gossypium arboreum TaxID=29729 RepID=A0A0B0NX84_GOSAR|nr:hypothetical protein F383_22092 [Gossypium arboreum]
MSYRWLSIPAYVACHQASSDWRSSEIASHYQIVISGIDDLNILSIWHV